MTTLTICPDCDGQKLMHGHDCDCPRCEASGLVPLQSHAGHSLENDTWFVRFYPFGSEDHAKAFEERIQSPISHDAVSDGVAVIEKCLRVAQRGLHEDAPFPMDEEQAKIWHSARAEAFRHSLEMMAPVAPLSKAGLPQ